MTKKARARAALCPTCPNGHCPSINTTPKSPQPDQSRINAAERMVPDLLTEEFSVDDRHEVLASTLVDRLQARKYGKHLRASAEWAIHHLVKKKLLSVHAAQCVYRPAPSSRSPVVHVRDDARKALRRNEVQPVILPFEYGKAAANFDTFLVRAEKAIWRWWRAVRVTQLSVQPVDNPFVATVANIDSYGGRDLCKALGIESNATLKRYAVKAGVPTAGRGESNFRFSAEDRKRIFEAVVQNAPEPLAKKAKRLLEEIALKSKEYRKEIEIPSKDRN